jgi:hypothetical protein
MQLHKNLKEILIVFINEKPNIQISKIKKLTTRCICAPNSKLCTQISFKLCYKTRESFTKVECSTWHQTSNYLKYYSYHIRYSNVTYLGSLES